ncbi:MAG: hypothetical protein QOI58_2307 [Thermoanaerobaculia bacterium]|jgi:hypothetical protein|nr:hypothetical protein [Thermoanaerobaculia bacterium]
MNRRTAIVFVSCSLLISACATHARTSTVSGCATTPALTSSQPSASSIDNDWLITAPPILVSQLAALEAKKRGQVDHSASMSVALTMTSDTVNKINLQWLRDTTLAVIAEQVPNARNPMTINVKLEVTSRFEGTPKILYSEGVVGVDGTSSFTFQNQETEQITGYRVVYTISDATGQVVESNRLTLDDGQLVDIKAGAPLKARYGLVGDTAMFLASRVKTLDQ